MRMKPGVAEMRGGGMGPLLLQVVAGLGVVAMALLTAGCGDQGESAGGESGETRVIVASIHPLADLASQVAGPGFEVQTLLSAGATPHGFELTAEKMRLLGRADLVLAVGSNVDPWADRAAEQVAGDLPVLHMAEMVDRAAAGHEHAHDNEHDDHGHGHARPEDHLWLDPVLARQWVDALREELVSRFPDRSAEIERNATAVVASLEELDQAYREQLANVPRKELVTFHNAFDRLAERYGLEVVAHLTEVELDHGAEIRPDRWRQAVAAVRTHDLRVLYSEPQFPDRAIASLQREAGVDVLRLDPLGHPRREGFETYQAMMRSNLATLVDGQSRSRWRGEAVTW
ncbi:MAG: metal ABC transporter substrate-binding protein [Phycisphaeraceae bacterium]